MPAHSSLLLLVTLWASMQNGLGLPVQQLEVERNDGVPTHQVRTKRCACSNQLDSECHYFCHLDIIWVNTPSKTTIYGLGGALSRHRRSTDRCACANPDDQTCTSFCRLSPEVKSLKKYQFNILSILRYIMETDMGIRMDGSYYLAMFDCGHLVCKIWSTCFSEKTDPSSTE